MTKSRYDFFLTVIIMISFLLHGGYFPMEYTLIVAMQGLLILYGLYKRKENAIGPSSILILSIIMLLAYIISTVFIASDKFSAINETIKVLGFVFSIYSVYLVDRKDAFITGVLTACSIIAGIGLLAYLDVITYPNLVLKSGDILRLQSLLQYANTTALLMAVGFIISYYKLMINREDKSQLYYTISYVFLLSLFLTLSRGMILIFVLVVYLWLRLIKESELLKIWIFQLVLSILNAFYMNVFAGKESSFLVFSIMVLGIVLNWYVVSRSYKYLYKIKSKYIHYSIYGITWLGIMFTFLKIKDIGYPLILEKLGTWVGRLIYYSDAIRIIKDNLFLGIGPGEWTYRQFEYQTAQYYVKYVHNSLLQFALDGGIITLLAFLSVIIAFYYQGIKNYKKDKEKIYSLSIVIVTLITLHSLIDIDLSFISILITLGGFMALGTFESFRKMNINTKVINIFIIMMAIGTLYIFVGQFIFFLAQGEYKDDQVEKAISLYEKSTLFRPLDSSVYYSLGQIYKEDYEDLNKALKLVSIARDRNPYYSKYVEELIVLSYYAHDYESMYKNGLQFVKIQSLSNIGYEAALYALVQKLHSGSLDIKEYENEVNRLINIMYKANKNRHSLSIYINHQNPIRLSKKIQDILQIYIN